MPTLLEASDNNALYEHAKKEITHSASTVLIRSRCFSPLSAHTLCVSHRFVGGIAIQMQYVSHNSQILFFLNAI